MASDTYTINLGDISFEYSPTSSDSITLDSFESYAASDIITLTGSSSDSTFSMDWFEDQRIVDEYKEEREIRERNEGVQAAWEQYKIMVALAKEAPENLDNLE